MPDTSRMRSLHHAASHAAHLTDEHWVSAQTLSDFVNEATANQMLWRSTLCASRLLPEHVERAAAIAHERRMLILLEDWCVDAVHAAGAAQRLVDANALLSLRVLRRDEHPDVMDAHHVGAARSIPVIIAFDHHGYECGWWGPRPSPLQTWIETEMQCIETSARSPFVRDWYTQDAGVTTETELLLLLESPRIAHSVLAHGEVGVAAAAPTSRNTRRT